jgi:hypothetical protein
MMQAKKVKVIYRDNDVTVVQLDELIPRSHFVVIVGKKAWLIKANAKELEDFLTEKMLTGDLSG